MGNITYSIGDKIEYETFSGARRVVLVDEKDDDIKDGRPGFGGVIISSSDRKNDAAGDDVWGYDADIVRVVR